MPGEATLPRDAGPGFFRVRPAEVALQLTTRSPRADLRFVVDRGDVGRPEDLRVALEDLPDGVVAAPVFVPAARQVGVLALEVILDDDGRIPIGLDGSVHTLRLVAGVERGVGGPTSAFKDQTELTVAVRGDPGDPVRGFGDDGLATLDSPDSQWIATEMAVDPDDGSLFLPITRAVPGGTVIPIDRQVGQVAKLDVDGRLDRNFGIGGFTSDTADLPDLGPSLSLDFDPATESVLWLTGPRFGEADDHRVLIRLDGDHGRALPTPTDVTFVVASDVDQLAVPREGRPGVHVFGFSRQTFVTALEQDGTPARDWGDAGVYDPIDTRFHLDRGATLDGGELLLMGRLIPRGVEVPRLLMLVYVDRDGETRALSFGRVALPDDGDGFEDFPAFVADPATRRSYVLGRRRNRGHRIFAVGPDGDREPDRDIAPGLFEPVGLALQGDGSLLVSMQQRGLSGDSPHTVLRRYRPDGSQDERFGDGSVSIGRGPATFLVVDDDRQRVYVAGGQVPGDTPSELWVRAFWL